MKLNTFFFCFVTFTLSYLIGCSPSDIDVSGDVFIVTKGGENIKLGLVEVNVFPDSVFKSFLKNKLQAAKSDLLQYKPLKEKLRKELDGTQISNWEKYKLIFHKWAELKDELIDKYINGGFLMTDLPTSLVKTKTDADGKFIIKLKPDNYAIVASASRIVGDKTEKYYWIIWFTVDSKKQNRIMLSNDNLYDSKNDTLYNLDFESLRILIL
jgi:hypothetical protein